MQCGYFADRLLLAITLVWIGLRGYFYVQAQARPGFAYEPILWLGRLVFPTHPSPVVWGILAAIALGCTLVCLFGRSRPVLRAVLAVSVVLLLVPEMGFGKVSHMNHLFLLAHIFSVLLPVGKAAEGVPLEAQATAFAWYRAGVLFPYTLAGLSKWIDITIRAAVKPGMTWLNPDATILTSINNYRTYDLPLVVPEYLASASWLMPVGFIGLALLLSVASLAAFRRPLLVLLVPTIALFHLVNFITLYVVFLSTIVVALAVLFPWDVVVPKLREGGVRVVEATSTGRGGARTYVRRYEDGSTDVYRGLYALRARLADRSWLFAAPLYYPGLLPLGHLLLRTQTSQGEPAS